jgi:hypothetical protein
LVFFATGLFFAAVVVAAAAFFGRADDVAGGFARDAGFFPAEPVLFLVPGIGVLRSGSPDRASPLASEHPFSRRIAVTG